MQISNLLIGKYLRDIYKVPIVYLGNNKESKKYCNIYLNTFSSIFITQLYYLFILIYSYIFKITIISLDDGILRCAGFLPFTCENIVVINSGSLAIRSSKTFLGKLSIYLSRISTKLLKAHFISESTYDQLKLLNLTSKNSFILGRPCTKNVLYRTIFNLKPPIKFITYGRLDNDKNIINLLNSFLEVSKCESIKLDIYGKGQLVQEVKSYSDLSSSINYLGEMDHFSLLDRLNEYDYFISISNNPNETFGRSWIEAGSRGLPFIGSNIGNLPYLIKNDINGYISGISVNDISLTLNKLIKNHLLSYKALSNNASRTSENYTNKNIFNQLKSSLDKIL